MARRLGRTGRRRRREVLHRVLYPNAHKNGIKKKKKSNNSAIATGLWAFGREQEDLAGRIINHTDSAASRSSPVGSA